MELIDGNKQQFVGIDLFKLLFALLIPLLHIDYTDEAVYNFLEQCCARLGVPFFFCCTGFLFERGLRKTDLHSQCTKFVVRQMWILVFWGIVALPITVWSWYGGFNIGFRGLAVIAQSYLFKTPGYLWYITASIVGIVIFTILKRLTKDNLKVILAITSGLYIIGTLGNSWGGGTTYLPRNILYSVFNNKKRFILRSVFYCNRRVCVS